MLKSIIVLLIGLLFMKIVHAQKSNGITRNVLNAILKEGDWVEKSQKYNVKYKTDTSGKLIAELSPNKKNNISSACKKIVLVDTFNFFDSQCSGKYGDVYVQVYNQPLSNYEKHDPPTELIYVSNIFTGQENSLCISFANRISNEFMIYYLSISGNRIAILKKKKGDL